jgi:hypothetical protein
MQNNILLRTTPPLPHPKIVDRIFKTWPALIKYQEISCMPKGKWKM